MQSIRTKYHGPSNVKGSRISAKCEYKTIYVPYASELDSMENHKAAAEKLRDIMGWNTKVHGDLKGGVFNNDYYWVLG